MSIIIHQMKTFTLLLLITLILFVGCKEDDEIDDVQSEYILAGVESENIDIQLYPSGLKIDFKNETAGGNPTNAYSGDLWIDLDADYTDDVKFHAYYGYAFPMAGPVNPTKACKMSATEGKHIEISQMPLLLNDTIDNKIEWELIGSNLNGRILSSYIPEWTNNVEVANNVWVEENLYLAFRVNNGPIFKLGWMKLSIEDYYDLDIQAYGLEK